MKKTVFLFSLLICISGCTKREIKTITDLFDQQEQLSHKSLDISDESDILLSPGALLVDGKQMIVHTTRSPKLFALVDLNSNTVTKTWGNIGNGPGEFLGILDFYKNYTGTGINAWDPMSQRLNYYPFEKIVSNDTTLLPVDLFAERGVVTKSYFEEFYVNIIQLSETKFLGQGNNEDKRFTLIDITNNKKIKTGDFPQMQVEEEIPHLFKIQAYNGLMRYNSKQNKIAYLSFESEMFEIFHVSDTGLSLTYGNYTTIPKYSMVNDGESNTHLKVENFTNGVGRGVAFTNSDEKIWILYQEYEKGATYTDSEESFPNDANKILVFDWNGKPLKMYNLDCMVQNIVYDAQTNRIYAIKSNPDPEIIFFELQTD